MLVENIISPAPLDKDAYVLFSSVKKLHCSLFKSADQYITFETSTKYYNDTF